MKHEDTDEPATGCAKRETAIVRASALTNIKSSGSYNEACCASRRTRIVNGAKSYYSTADYYSEGQELTGRWRGEAARRLGLQGDVKQADWDALCDNLHPADRRATDGPAASRPHGRLRFQLPRAQERVAALRDDDATNGFSMPSAMPSTARCTTWKPKWPPASARAARTRTARTGNMAWGEFIHFTSRPVDGVPDPHLHAHCFVFNTTFDKKEQAWKAGQFRELKRDAPYFEAVFHSRLAHRLADLGLPIERTKKGWELGGVDRES